MMEERIAILPPPPSPLLALRAAAHALYQRLSEALNRVMRRLSSPPPPRARERRPALPLPPYGGRPTVIAVRRPA